MEKNFFPSYKLSKTDCFIGGLFLAFCYTLFFHGDIWGVGWDSLNYLFGSPLEFYDNCKKIRGGGQNMLGTPYPPTIYAIFAAWLYPFKLVGLLTSPEHFPAYLTYWLKALTTLVYAASGVVFYKITQVYSSDKSWGKYATAIWLTTPLAIFSQFIFSQYDIFYVILTLAGFLMFLRGRLLIASLLFGIAITFKYFPVFVFIPLLLLIEKRILRLLFYFVAFMIPTLLIQYFYGQSPAFIEGVKSHSAISRIFAASIDLGGWRIYYLFAAFTLLCGFAYLSEVSRERLPNAAAYIFLVGTVLPFLLIIWHPQWTMFFAPAIVLTTVIDKRCEKFLTLDLIGMAFFVAAVSIAFQDNVDAAMFKANIFGFEFNNSYKMARIFDVFKEHSANVFLSAFWGYLVVQIIFKFKPVMEEIYPTTSIKFDFKNVRYRLYVGLLVFIIPALIAVIKDYRKNNRLIVNEVSGNHYGELLKTRTFEQSFTAKRESLEEIELFLATFSRQNSGSIMVGVVDSSNNLVGEVEASMAAIKDNAWQEFSFGPISLVTGAVYKIRLTSSSGKTGNAITWWASPNNSYQNGNAIVDGVLLDTDFGFRIKFASLKP